MSDNATDMVPENRPTPAPSAGPPAAGGDAGDRHKAAPLWMVLGGLAAGLAAFAVGEMILNLIPPEKVAMRVMGRPVMAPSAASVRVAMTKNGTLTFGVFGACLAGFLGMAGGLARRSTGWMAAAGLLGAILGLAVAGGASFGLLPFFLKIIPNHPDYDLTISALMHATIWGLLGASAGLAFAVGLGERSLLGRALAAGFVGAVLGAVVFDLIGAGLFPFADTGQPISTTWQTRLMARLMISLATAAAIILVLPRSQSDKALPQAVVAPPVVP